MVDELTFIFSNFWVFIGFNITILTVGYASAMPFYWWYKLKQFKTAKSQFWDISGQ